MARTFRPLFLAGALAAASVAAIASGQAVVQSLAPGDADLLATQMRALAANPRDLNALATAGELSIKLGDLSGAAALFARADRIDPRNGRVKAGMGSILVRSERPGEALRFFQQAETSGWTAGRFAADRGLAYDLIGEQRRAQADYRVALATASDDETIRRYALSLGIAGKQTEALAQLDPLVRKQDRAAWRARAFVLAMGGDTAGAEKIATTMMPAGVAQGLGLFFQRLPTLPAADRAFAVHFGEIAATPERIADARLTPALAALPPEQVASAPVQVAAVTPQVQPDRRSVRRTRPGRQTLSTTAAPVVLAANTTVARPGFGAQPGIAPATASATSMRETDVRVAATPSRPATPAVTVQPVQSVVAQPVVRPAPAQVAQVAPQPVQTAAAPPPSTEPVAPVQTAAATRRADSVLARIVASLSIPAAELGVVEPIVATTAPPRPVVPVEVASAPRSTDGRRVVAEAAAKEARDTAVRRTVAAKLTGDADADDAKPLTPAQKRAADRQAAADKRAEERALAKMTPAQRRAAARKAATDAATTDDVAEVKLTPAQKRAADRQAVADKRAEERALAKMTPAQRRAAARKAAAESAEEPVEIADAKLTPAQRRAAARKAAAEEAEKPLTPAEKRAAARKVLADKKADAEKKDLADKAAADKKAVRSNPSRIWVQVAGGANQGDLAKAWSGVKAKSPALAARAGYSTPLRATNRVLTGPFKTDAEARAFVNQLAKQGVSAFPFTSDAGQTVTKLGGK
ncbi:SPOR domain-containing protein [Sphingomonas sp. Leaf343]|uniref:SPOR domain-containing protein n=1 Tax=Sphingomonas sp. Leaf343 TaxID=1736345 RepID=UPI00070029D4|nr:SPOR domain-containing protein [Sphingomonas sp. Leaf343]KQR87864.1 hypothetical protein ASG07_03095 [Sphingomonas sp. Leaf343]